jgi:hypothetical protein
VCATLRQAAARAVTGKRSYKQLVDEAGATKSIIREGQAVIDAASLGARAGKEMTVVSGRHAGLKCVVQAVMADDGALRTYAHRACPSICVVR